MKLRPITLRAANEFVNQHHRHNGPTQGHKFSIGLEDQGELIGVVIVGRPISRHMDDGLTAEILRVCVLSRQKNANSMLYGAAIRACRAMGYERVITYTLPSESGASLKAVGFEQIGRTAVYEKGWCRPSRPRNSAAKYPVGEKLRWSKTLSTR